MSDRKQNQARYFRTFLAVGVGFLGFALSAGVVHADLEVLPEQGVAFTGYPGGPFTPTEAFYQLTNTSQDLIEWTAEPNVAWVDISPAGGTLSPGQTITVIIEPNETHSYLPFDNYYGEIVFTDLSNELSQSRSLQLLIIPWNKLIAFDGAAEDYFGKSVAISGDYTIVGAYRDDDNGDSSGSAYIFQRSGVNWIQQSKLTASDGAAYDYFGYSVSIRGDYAIVGAYLDDDNGDSSGSAYIFERNGSNWNQQAKLTASDGAAGDYFGYSVSISGDYAIVGAYRDDDNGDRSGSAYIFQRSDSNWNQQAKLTASDGAAGDYFGYSVSISGDYAIVGAYRDDDNGDRSGSAYIFQRSDSNWIQQSKLTASDGAAYDDFGYSVAISGDYTIVGVHHDDDNGNNSGSAYIFQRSGVNWIQQAKLTASDGASYDYFGYSVAISGHYAIVGAHHDDDHGSESGSAYIFQRSGVIWIQQTKLTASDGAVGDYFGTSVAISSDKDILIGAYGDDDHGGNSGSAYIFILDNLLVMAAVSPEDFVSSGYIYGPFAPEDKEYVLFNDGTEELDWQVEVSESWLSVDYDSGTLTPGAETTVTVTLNENANTLVLGTHTGTITFTNLTSTISQIRNLALTILEPLEVLPEHGYEPTVPEGGPFIPAAMDYTLTNASNTSFFCVIEKDADWLDLDPAWLELEPNTPQTISVSLNSVANSLTQGIYTDTLIFTNTSTGQEQTRDVTLTVHYYNGGNGDANDPFQIAEPNQLIYMSRHPEDWDKHFLLTADLNMNLAEPNTFTSAVIVRDPCSIVSFGKPFSGVFDGNGHIIRNLTIDPGEVDGDCLGLFGKVENGTIRNLGIEGIIINNGNDYVGGLVGYNHSGTISNCYSDGSVTGMDYSNSLGGLCGKNYEGNIDKCYATGSVTSGDFSDYLGGLCGYNNQGSISNCYATDSVTGGVDSHNLGGLCGQNYDFGNISNCYATGSVTGGVDSYHLGGLCGVNYDYGSIRNCYATGSVTGGSSFGGLCGWNEKANIIKCFFLDTAGPDNGLGTPLTDSQMKQQSSFVGWDFIGETTHGIEDIWRMCVDGIEYPKLYWQFSTGDFTCPDGVEMLDLWYFCSHWLSEGDNLRCDIAPVNNPDDIVNLLDYAEFTKHWLRE